jgi:adenylate cyclase
LSQEQRKLAAIVFTDIVGFTALSQRDEARALRLLEKHNELFRSYLASYHGREIKTMGDGFLLEFESALDATRYAIEVQKKLHEYTLTVDNEDRISVRIGIHVGDVVYRGADVLGDAVNISSRIQSFADPNGICITEPVFIQVRNKIPNPLPKLSEQKLKNVEVPMNLYQVILGWEATSTAPVQIQPLKTRIAVLPFENISPDPNDSYFADGLTEELITVLSQIKELRVIAKTSVSRFKGTNKGVSQIGSELRVGSILEGSVRKSANKVRVTVQLIDVASEEHVWVSQYDRDLNDIFLIQSDIAKNVSDELRVTLAPSEQKRVERKETENAIAHETYLKGRTLLRDRTEQGMRSAREQFELAIKYDPNYARAHAGLADVWDLLGEYRFAPSSECREKAEDFRKSALDLDPDLPEARASLAASYVSDYRYAEATEEFKHAITLNPSYAMAHCWYADCLRDQGRFEDALFEVSRAEELDPLSPVISYVASDMYLSQGDDEEVLKRARKIQEIDPESPFAIRALADFYLVKPDYTQALTCYRKMKQLSGNRGENIDSYIGYVYAVTNRHQEAIDILNTLQNNYPEDISIGPMDIAWVYLGLDDIDACFKWLHKAFQEHACQNLFGFIRYFPLPSVEKIRRDSRFNELLKKANLPLEPEKRLFPIALKPSGRAVARDEGPELLAFHGANEETKVLFDFLVEAFIEDYMRKRLYIDQSGWRSLIQIADACKIPQRALYGRSGRYGPTMTELIRRGLVEARTFTGHRGRGGNAIKVRIAYDREPTRHYVDKVALKS